MKATPHPHKWPSAGLLWTVLSTALRPLSWIWQGVTWFRRFLYRSGIRPAEKFQIPIISIGNITFGGTGKTPLTLWLADLLHERGLRPVVCMRGHKGDLEKSSGFLKAGQSAPQDVYYGDEPMLLARRMKEGGVIVGRKRAANLKFYFPKVDPHVVLLDDGLQHIQIQRDLDIVLFDVSRPLHQYRVVPSGMLREGPSALRDAHVIVLGRCDQVSEEQIQLYEDFLRPYIGPKTPIIQSCYRPQGLFNAHDELICPKGDLQGKRILAVAAIGHPQSFFRSLEGLGAELVYKLVFPDHYYFKESDIENFLKKSHEFQADYVVITEKDMMKIRRLNLSEKILYMGIQIDFLKGEEILKEKVYEVALRSL